MDPVTPPAGEPPVTPPAGDSPVTPPVAPVFSDMIPEEYKGKPYMENIKSADEMFKQFDNLQPLIGATKIPKADAPKEEWDKVYAALGRPETAEGYELNSADVEIPDHARAFNSAMEKTFHEVGISKTQAEAIAKSFGEQGKLLSDTQGVLTTEQQKVAFNEAADKILGAEKEATLEVADKMMEKYAPDAVKAQLAGADPETKAAFASVLKGMVDDYVSEDDLASLKTGTPSGSFTTAASARVALRDAMRDEDFKNAFAGDAHVKAVEKVNNLSGLVHKLETENK